MTKRSAVKSTPCPSKKKRVIVEEEEEGEENVEDKDNDQWEDEENGNEEEEDDLSEEEELVEGSDNYEKKLKQRDDRRFADWIVGKLNEPGVYLVLRARNSGTPKAMLKARVYRTLMAAFNKNPPNNITFKIVTESQVKNKIEYLKKAFRKAHKLVKKPGEGGKNGEGWRKRVKKKCRHYFDLEDNWAVEWTLDVPSYTNSLSNMDDSIITDDIPRRLQKGKQCTIDLSRNGANSVSFDLTHDDDEEDWWIDKEDFDSSMLGHSVEGTPRSTSPYYSRLETPGPSRAILMATISALTAEPSRTPITASEAEAAVSTAAQPSSSKTTKANTSKSGPGTGGDLDFSAMFIKGMEREQTAQKEKIALKWEQFEFMKMDHEARNTIEMQRIMLEARQLELENERMLEKQRLDAEYRLAKLKAQQELQVKNMNLNAELRNRGREPVPTVRIQTTLPPTTPPSLSHSDSPTKNHSKSP